MSAKSANDKTFTDAIMAARKEIEELSAQRDAIEKRIKRLMQSVAALYRLTLGDDESNPFTMGLTDAIKALAGVAYPAGITSGMCVQLLERMGFDFSDYKNKQASVHGTLQRLH